MSRGRLDNIRRTSKEPDLPTRVWRVRQYTTDVHIILALVIFSPDETSGGNKMRRAGEQEGALRYDSERKRRRYGGEGIMGEA